MPSMKWSALAWISICELFSLSLWFSATAVVYPLLTRWQLVGMSTSWITISLQVGFICGCLLSSILGLSDKYAARTLFYLSSFAGALVNVLLIFTHSASIGLTVRFLTGIAMAGVYPTAVKLVSERYQAYRGLSIGILVGALTLGSALPHFILSLASSIPWQTVIGLSSMLTVLSGFAMKFIVKDVSVASFNKPVSLNRSSSEPARIREVITNRGVMWSNLGYFGHMWELYAMRTWIPIFLATSHPSSTAANARWSFLIIGVSGAVGSLFGGMISDRIGRHRLTIWAMAVSGLCALTIGLSYQKWFAVTIVIAMVWGISVIADSAQFSASIADFAHKQYLGTALTFQMCVGFFITNFSIYLLPVIVRDFTWHFAFMILAIGPIVGIIAMCQVGKLARKRLAQS